jgi:hypothetical protein
MIFLFTLTPDILIIYFSIGKINDLKLEKASAIVKVECCEHMCLQNCMLYNEAVIFVKECLTEVENMEKKDKKYFLRQKIQQCVELTSELGYFKYKWKIGLKPGKVITGCCRKLFMLCYDIKKDYLER